MFRYHNRNKSWKYNVKMGLFLKMECPKKKAKNKKCIDEKNIDVSMLYKKEK